MEVSDISSASPPDPSPNPIAQQSDQNRIGLWLILLLLAIGGALSAWWWLGRSRAPQGQMGFGPMNVELMEVQQSQIEQQSSFVGTLDAEQGVVLKPEIDGQVVQIFVSSGDQVTAGAPIVRLSPDRRQAEVNTAIANTNVSRATLSNAQAQVRTAQAERAQADAEVALQNEEIQRIEFLVEEGAESQQRLDQTIRNRDAAIASLNAATERIEAAKAAEASARAALQQAESQVTVVQTDLSDTLITAPINGVVGDIPVKLGDYVEVGDNLTSIVQNQTLELSLSVPIEYRDRLRLGLPVTIRRFAGDEQTVDGRIGFISPQVNASTQTIMVEAMFTNPSGQLTDDQRVDATITWEERPGLLVPTNAVSRLAGQPFIFVAIPSTNEETGEPQLIAEQRAVTLGGVQGNNYQVIEGLEAGESIVSSGILNLSNGMAIAPQEDPANAPSEPVSESPETNAQTEGE